MPQAAPSTRCRRDPPEPLTHAAAACFVLLKNDARLLPASTSLQRGVLAVLGPNALEPCYQGWGSPMVAMGLPVDPLAAITDRFNLARVIAEPGCPTPYTLHGFGHLDPTTPDAQPRRGLLVEYFRGASPAGPPAHTEVRDTNALNWGDVLPLATRDETVFVRARATFTPGRSGNHAFFVRGSGPSSIAVDDHEVAALPAQATSDDILAAWFSDATGEGHVRLRAGQAVRIAIEMACEPGLYHLLRFGCRPPEAPDLLDRAIAAARAAALVVLIVGTNQDIETESRDRDTSSLPVSQDELVERVLDTNPSTAIIVNAGRAVDLPWASNASTILYSWLPGHAFGAGPRLGPGR